MGIYMWRDVPLLCFTANTANSTVQLTKTGSPTVVTLETSTDGSNWSTYTIGTTITLSNIGDKVYFRNTSTTTTGFNISYGNRYTFSMSGSIAAGGDVTSLINRNCTDTLGSNSSFAFLFFNCQVLTTPPELPATTLCDYCYQSMFDTCMALTQLPKLPALTLTRDCYRNMFSSCYNIKMSTSQTGEYQTAYRIPSEGTGADGNSSMYNMFTYTGGTFTGTPTINTTYYTSNTVA